MGKDKGYLPNTEFSKHNIASIQATHTLNHTCVSPCTVVYVCREIHMFSHQEQMDPSEPLMLADKYTYFKYKTYFYLLLSKAW